MSDSESHIQTATLEEARDPFPATLDMHDFIKMRVAKDAAEKMAVPLVPARRNLPMKAHPDDAWPNRGPPRHQGRPARRLIHRASTLHLLH